MQHIVQFNAEFECIATCVGWEWSGNGEWHNFVSELLTVVGVASEDAKGESAS